jgi:hypothetical protein
MNPILRSVLVLVLTAATAGSALAQGWDGRHDRRQEWGGAGRMSGEERQRLREDIQRQHIDPRRQGGDFAGEERARRYAEWQRMSPEQREGIRRDMRDYNRDYDRRR